MNRAKSRGPALAAVDGLDGRALLFALSWAATGDTKRALKRAYPSCSSWSQERRYVVGKQLESDSRVMALVLELRMPAHREQMVNYEWLVTEGTRQYYAALKSDNATLALDALKVLSRIVLGDSTAIRPKRILDSTDLTDAEIIDYDDGNEGGEPAAGEGQGATGLGELRTVLRRLPSSPAPPPHVRESADGDRRLFEAGDDTGPAGSREVDVLQRLRTLLGTREDPGPATPGV